MIRVTRYRLRVGVGLLWLVAGGLQLQTFMFTKDFSDDVLGTAALSQPAPLAHLITDVQHAVGEHPALWNWPFAVLQLAIGLAMVLARRGTVARLAATASVAWGIEVWLIGEGAGGLLTGHGALSTGAPGAALLYSLLTAAAWPHPSGPADAIGDPGPTRERPPAARIMTWTWVGTWLTGAVLATLPAQRGASGLSAQAAMSWMMSPSWTVGPTGALMRWLAGLLIDLAYWVFGQGLGALSTGTATDVGTAPLIALLALAIVWAQPRSEFNRSKENEHEPISADRSHRSNRRLVGADGL